MTLRGKLTIERADNGVVLEWYVGRDMEKHREVFQTSGAAISRIAGLTRIFELDEKFNIPVSGTSIPISGTHVDPATDADVAAYAPPNVPPTVPTGD